MFAGTWGGTMCLTEPHAGSALDKLRTIATRQEDGSYRIVGNKCFISAGDQDLTENIIHLVLARTPDAPKGTRGLSLFVVPSVREDQSPNDVTVTALEEKMGLHGSPTCGLAFGDQGDCTGYILGGEGEGLRHMFLMMNEARIAVGLQGVAIANLAYQLALEYARERVQGVPAQSMRDVNAKEVAIIEHPDVRRMLLTMKAYSEGIRSLLLGTATFFDRAAIAESEAERDRYEDLINILTPICKAYGSYRAFEVADLGIMVHGGYGYIREYKIEGLLRDVKIAAIYEGTNGIQALDLLGRKVARKGGKLFMTCVQWINELIASAKDHPVVGELAAQLSKSRDDLTGITMELGTKSRGGDLVYPILSASPYLELFGDVVVGRLLVEQALLAANRLEEDVPPRMKRFYEAKIETARFFVYQLLPRTGMLAQSIRSDDRSALNIQF